MQQLTPAISADNQVASTLSPEHSPERAPFRKAALAAAIAWTIGIFVACLWPGKELPHSDIPFIDKWTHFVLFGGFSVLWLCAYPSLRPGWLLLISLIATALGCLVEGLQTWLPELGRSGDVMDAVADAAGGVLGVAGFRAVSAWIFRLKR